ncbi:MAG TPA: CaiB/BaiF CoA-transferase family protein [Terricaulis sp.]|nr:CaiB/BaiF CoA-transferase family protein [Terricaulis sp.]
MPGGPLKGFRILEFAGLGPVPHCCMLLADMGADVVRIDRAGPKPTSREVVWRGREHLTLDLKEPKDVVVALDLAASADVLVEGFRPGVMERLGLGPDEVLSRNPRLVYGRMTGWGQHGPLAAAAGHDVNYIAISGALHAMGRGGAAPSPPLNLVGDYGGGSLYLALGICAALLETQRSGQGQVIDCAMSDGVASLMALFYGLRGIGAWGEARDANLLDGGAPFYDVYTCADGKFVAIGALEPQFYRLLLKALDVEGEPLFAEQMNQAAWPEMSARIAKIIAAKPQAAWTSLMEGTDACFAPVLSMAEAPNHPHNRARGAFIELDGVTQPAPAPRFSRTPSAAKSANADATDPASVLARWARP